MDKEQENVDEPQEFVEDTEQVMDELFTKMANTDAGEGQLSTQEENWLLMTLLQIPWHHCNKIDDPADRKFLLGRAEQIKKMAVAHQQQEMEMQQQMMQQQGEQEGKILTPQDFMPPNM